ncbi:hypothetical protein ON010_g13590 [Phytophthora cinnamomi]|nr:hypothetical protein ON010_g13590 [Phytophthora cinnamomi]
MASHVSERLTGAPELHGPRTQRCHAQDRLLPAGPLLAGTSTTSQFVTQAASRLDRVLPAAPGPDQGFDRPPVTPLASDAHPVLTPAPGIHPATTSTSDVRSSNGPVPGTDLTDWTTSEERPAAHSAQDVCPATTPASDAQPAGRLVPGTDFTASTAYDACPSAPHALGVCGEVRANARLSRSNLE